MQLEDARTVSEPLSVLIAYAIFFRRKPQKPANPSGDGNARQSVSKTRVTVRTRRPEAYHWIADCQVTRQQLYFDAFLLAGLDSISLVAQGQRQEQN
jgi:hypothetical protein